MAHLHDITFMLISNSFRGSYIIHYSIELCIVSALKVKNMNVYYKRNLLFEPKVIKISKG